MKIALRSASTAAILVGITGLLPAFAQEAAQTIPADQAGAQSEPSDSADRVVVTGSFIRGTPEDAALPVEVFSIGELEDRGSPSALEFAKSLTIAGPTSGEAYYFGGPALIGSVNYNLRGIGADKTLTLLNGRRMNSNTSNIPFAALQRVEILKDGAAVIYGADATGGVVNFITRDSFEGLEVGAQYKYIDGSDGDYGLSILGGFGDDRSNFLWSAEWEHRSRLRAIDRDFTHDSFDYTKAGYNPAPWSTLTNLAGWLPLGPSPATPTIGANGAEFGAPIAGITSDFTPASCAAVGGRYDNSYTCAYNYSNYYNLVEDNDIYRAYAQFNSSFGESTNFHVEASYGQVKTPHMYASPAQPVLRGPAMATGATFQFYVPIDNPYAAAFAQRTGTSAAAGFTPVTYRLLGHGGNQAFGGQGVPDQIDNQLWRVSASLDGKLGDWASFAREVEYDFAVTYNQSISYNTHPDTIGYRLQEAMNGFGGPNCSAADLDPARFGTQNAAAAGKNGCQWWNPFATSFPNQPVRDLANPQYVAGTENSLDLTRWMFDQRAIETVASNLTFDLVFNGKSGLQLPGGEVGWALGAQGRQFESRETVNSPLFNGSTPCEWPTGTTSGNGVGSPNLEQNPIATNDPRFRGCTPDSPGPFVAFVPDIPNSADQQQYSVFGEVQIPVLDNVNLQAAVRREEFSGGLGATVYKVAGKWNVWGPLSVRGSYGTNYQTPPVGTSPGQSVVAARTYTVAAGNWLGARFITDASLKPETAKSWNVGAIWDSTGFAPEHNFRLIVDYFDIRTEDQIGQIADPNQIASLVFNGAGGTITTCDPNVQPLIRRITFNGSCSVGMSGVGTFSMVDTQYGNGPGQTTNGFDIQATYALPFGPGDLAIDLAATKVTELKTGPTSLDGVVVSTGDDRLGSLNFATFALAAPEWRANLSANYRFDRHNIRLGVNYVSAVHDERAGKQYGEDGEDWVTADATYRFQFSDDLALTATIANIFDRDPPAAQEELGYDPFMGNPLGRTIELGVKKAF
ncbi:MAG TPA: TonB-dependent receptor [Hyphomonadaceae bacterium]|nr:TonB-dependent receptor [Hyphomonadaceae bacterium]HPI47741.1 TonB-dependent receptor [Hyphomonadaceae bacterium]